MAGLVLMSLSWAVPPDGAAQESPAAGDWRVAGSVYGWLAGVDGSVAVGPRTEIPVAVPFSNLLENLDFAGSLHLEVGQPRGWTFLGDLFVADLGVSGALPPDERTVTLDLDMTILEGAVGHHLGRAWEVLGVVRYNDLSVRAETPENETDSRGANWVDAFAGVRYTPVQSERWVLAVRGDVGTGGSSLAWFGSANALFRLGGTTWLSSGYRLYSVDYEEGEGRDLVGWDMVTHGLFVGVVWMP